MYQGDIQGNVPGYQAKLGGKAKEWWAPDDTCGPSPESAKADEAQLTQAALEESPVKKKPKKSRYELERYASKIVKMGDDGQEPFYEHLGRRIREAGIIVASLTLLHSHNPAILHEETQLSSTPLHRSGSAGSNCRIRQHQH